MRLLNGADYLRVLGTEQAQTLGRLYLSGFDAYYVGLLFYGLASTACSSLFFKSGYIPRGLAAFGVIVSAWAVAVFVYGMPAKMASVCSLGNATAKRKPE